MDTLKYRNATSKDLERITEIYNSTIASRMVTADTEMVTVESRQKWFDEHHETRPIWVIEDVSNTIIGWVSFQPFYGRPAYASTVEISIYLDEQQRGKGVGKAVLSYCIAQAPHLGIKTLLGFIFAHNLPSLHLFQNFGFEEWAHLPRIAVLDGEEKGLKILGKRVAV